MGNKLGRRRQVVDEKYTKPQGLYQIKDVDIKKLRKLILESKLAPCYPGDDECDYECEECPICFLYYPSLNRSRCCMKGICTECFLQMKTPGSTRPTLCPFCKTSNYAVEYHGVKTKEEKGLEQREEQRVIEAKIRMRQQELQDEEERMKKRQEISSPTPMEAVNNFAAVPSSRTPIEGEGIVSSQDSCAAPMIRQCPPPKSNRDDEFDLDLEDIMVMEAIWLSIKGNGKQKNAALAVVAPSDQYVREARYVSPAMAPVGGSSSSPSGGLACAIAALAEHQQMGGESSVNCNGDMSAFNMLPGSSRFYSRVEQDAEGYPSTEIATEMSPNGRMAVTRNDREWGVDGGSEGAETGTSYASSNITDNTGGMSALPPPDEVGGSFQNGAGPIIPESFEEQMMLAMAVSLVEAHAITSGQGVTWQ